MTRATYTNLDVLQEKRIDDCWNVGANRSSSDSSKGFRKFTVLSEKPRKGTKCGPGRDLQRFEQLPDLIMCGLKVGLACQKQLRRRKAGMDKRKAKAL